MAFPVAAGYDGAIFQDGKGDCMKLDLRNWVRLFWGAVLVASWAGAQADGGEVAMVTLLQGNVSRVSPLGPQPVQAFTKLKHGDLLALDRDARLQVVYLGSGRQETWKGMGRLEITSSESTAYGLAPAETKILPPVMVRQIGKTPVLESQGRAGMMRLRSVASAGDIDKIEEQYRRMRLEAARNDINPELYLLSSLFELREFDRVEQALSDLQQRQRGNPDVGLVVALYVKAVKNAREAKGR